IYFFHTDATTYTRIYFFLVFFWTVLVWSVFGGAITRIAAVQVARGEKIGLAEAVRDTPRRPGASAAAPLFPPALIVIMIVIAAILGLPGLIPILGDIVVFGVLYPVFLVLALVIVVALLGFIVGWPLMSPTISAEGTDSWEAVSRSFSYVFTKPFQYAWYALV